MVEFNLYMQIIIIHRKLKKSKPLKNSNFNKKKTKLNFKLHQNLYNLHFKKI